MKAFLLLLVLAAPAFGQFELQLVDAAGVRIAPPVFDLGSGYANEPLTARFRLRNTAGFSAAVSILTVGGVGFSLTAPALPVTVEPEVSLEFTVTFQVPDVGGYSAVLRAANVTILLTASVQPRLSYRMEDVPLPASIDFGGVERGGRARRRFTVTNETPQLLTVPAISTTSEDFVFEARPPSGTVLGPNQSSAFAIDFTPQAVGLRQGMLVLGDRTIPLTGTAVDPPPPRPLLSVVSVALANAKQGTLVVRFDKPAVTSGTGMATLDFRGSADPTVSFASGGRTAVIGFAAGDTRASLPFQTGTTTGTLVFTVRIGEATDTISAQIAPAAPGLTVVEGFRTAGGIEVRTTGWDNTHSVSQLAFTFYDISGNMIQPGAIRIDGTAEFARFYARSDLGGRLSIRDVFPVTGDAAQVASFDVSLSGIAGTSKSARTLIR